MDLNYFVCTLGQAAALTSESKPWRTISEFLHHQSNNNGQIPAVAFPVPEKVNKKWSYLVFTFEDVEHGATIVAEKLLQSCGQTLRKQQTIALLAHSSPEFLFTWLALILLGHSVLLIAPQCQPPAIAHLCRSCEVRLLLHDDSHQELATNTQSVSKQDGDEVLKSSLLTFKVDAAFLRDWQKGERINEFDISSVDTDIAYFHHTSGTSSGLPKPIPQSHRGALGVLPHIRSDNPKATFTTTPLYHGGIADLFRAWASDSLIWLFPGRDVPITARNICQCLEVTDECSRSVLTPPVGYFSSVPYVLQMMELDDQALIKLKGMEVVGVGGAALPTEIGDRLVKAGIHLISRFGSAECGFLLSSSRDFAADHDWQYLRNRNPSDLLTFESRDDGLSELIVRSGWPHMAKMNRPDGSFATADLFASHPSIINAWLYHSRADSQLTLITGKKFDPAPLEAAIGTSPHVDDVLIFGNQRPFAGALLLRSEKAKGMSDAELLQALTPHVDKLNRESQAHAKISHSMLIPVPYQEIKIEKSSKGTVIRRAAEERFKEYIEGAYEDFGPHEHISVADGDLPQYLADLIQSIVGSKVSLDLGRELFSYGMDSVASMQLRSRLRSLVPKEKNDLPLSIVEDCGNILALSEYIIRRRRGEVDANAEDEETLMRDLVERYSNFTATELPNVHLNRDLKIGDKQGGNLLLTGATGALGAHILDILRNDKSIAAIYCLVRGADEHAAAERVNKALEQRGHNSLHTCNGGNTKIKILCSQLGNPDLGLPVDIYRKLVTELDLIVHVAWTVNFRIRLRSFEKDNIAGVKHLIDLALQGLKPIRFLYCSSTAAAMSARQNNYNLIPEEIISDPNSASPLGYSRSKWVAEQICSNANRYTPLKDRIAVVRLGQLSGSSNHGIWNTQEAWPMMLSTAKLTGSLPDLPNEPLDWLPVDVAAQALLQVVEHLGVDKGMHVFHVLNGHQQPTWSNMLQWLREDCDFEIVSPNMWVEKLKHYEGTEHPALKLLGLWKEAYGNGIVENLVRPQFDVAITKRYAPVLQEVRPVNKDYMLKIWNWVQMNIA